jgi:putative ABC transport system permease protein
VGNLQRDLRLGFRLLLRNPTFTSVAVLTLALGIAANAVIFSVVYATFLAPLPYRDADRLVMLWSQVEGDRNATSAADFVEWRRQASVFEDLNAWTGREVNLATRDRPEHLTAGLATPRKLSMMGYGHPLALGRTFLDEEGTAGKDQVAILSHRLWRERFGADPAIVGRTIRVDGTPHTVVGVLGAGPADAHFFQLWLPLAFTSDQLDPRGSDHMLTVMGRLKPGVTVEEANANMAAITRRLTEAHPDAHKGWSVSVEPFRNDFLSDNTKRGLWLLFGAVLFVLLIACANVANLLLARATAREREMAVRVALGASRREIVQQLVAESLVLAALGGVLGVGLAYGLLRVVVALIPVNMLPTEADIRLSVPVLLFTIGACAMSGILSGCAPAWQTTRSSFRAALSQAGPSVMGSGHRLRRGLVVLEFALAVTLLTGGGLAIRSLAALTSVELGFRTQRVLTFSLPVREDSAANPDQVRGFYRELLDRVQTLPGVRSVAVSTGLPMRNAFGISFAVVGRPQESGPRRSFAHFNMITPSYFDTLGIRVTRGRSFDERDTSRTLPVAVVNETFVKRHLPDVDPLRQRLLLPQFVRAGNDPLPPIECQIVGVIADVRNRGVMNDPREEIVVPFWQTPWPSARVAIRTTGDPFAVRRGVESIVQSLDPELPLAEVKTLDQVVSESLATDRFNTLLFGSFGIVALLLAAIGVYGVMSFAVAQRTREIGLRMALGAERGQVVRGVLRQGLTTVLLGIGLGAAGAWYAATALRGIVYGVENPGPGPFVVVVLTLLCTALAACAVPAMRAASVDPITALRQE